MAQASPVGQIVESPHGVAAQARRQAGIGDAAVQDLTLIAKIGGCGDPVDDTVRGGQRAG